MQPARHLIAAAAEFSAGVQHATDETGGTRETVSFAFTEVEVEYRLQKSSGGRGGSTVFTDNLPQAES